MAQKIYWAAGPGAQLSNTEVPKRDIGGGIIMQIIAEADKINAVHWNLKDGAVVPRDHHQQEQFGYVIAGALELIVNGEKYIVKPGDSYIIPVNAEHEFRAVGDTEAIDVFTPPRDLSRAGGQGARSQSSV